MDVRWLFFLQDKFVLCLSLYIVITPHVYLFMALFLVAFAISSLGGFDFLAGLGSKV